MVAASGSNLDDLGIQALATVQALLDLRGEFVTAHSVEQADRGPVATFATIRYRGGLVLQLTVTTREAEEQLVAVTKDRSLTLRDDRLTITPRCNSGQTHERVLCTDRPDPITVEARDFVERVARGEAIRGNLQLWRNSLEIWNATRRSIAEGQSVWLGSLEDVETPPISIFEGGAVPARTPSGRRLALVG
jgi:predicted dehydrogenase